MRRVPNTLRIALLCGVGLLFIVAVLAVCVNAVMRETESSFNQFMEEVAEVESANIRSIIEGKLGSLHGVSALVTVNNIRDDEGLVDRFREVVESGAFSRVGLVDVEGRGIGYDAELGELPAQNYGDRAYVQAALRGEDFVTDPLDDSFGNEPSVAFAVPIYNLKHSGSDPIGALVGVTSAASFAAAIDSSLFDGNGYINVIDASGAVLFRSSHSSPETEAGVLSPEYEHDGSLAQMKDNLANGKGGSIGFTGTDGAAMLSLYQPIGINDWFIEVMLPRDYLENKDRRILLASIGMAAFVLAVVTLLMFAILRTHRRSQQALERAALADSLTGIDNELAFTRACSSHPEFFDGRHYLILFNLVGFSLFNTIFGYPQGSELLRRVARILSESVRKNDLVARLSGDRFVLLAEAPDAQQGEARLLEAMDRVDEAVRPEGTQYRIASQCCICLLTSADVDRDINLLVQDMALPLHQAKDQAGTRIVRYDAHDVAAANRTRRIEALMTDALSREEFVAYFQPQYDIRDGQTLCGAEALVRWRSPVLGLVMPNEFIPLFEKNGFIDRIDRYMLERACMSLREWMDQGMRCVPVSVNLSRRNLFSSNLVSRVKSVVGAYGVPRSLIKFEITESIVSENEEQLAATVRELQANGFRVSLDDFGTGYSAFSAIADIPFDAVKLDRSFFGASMRSDQGRKTVVGVIELLDRLGFETVAEGVEEDDEIGLLRSWGCKVVQSFAFGRPAPADEYLRDHLQPAQASLHDAGSAHERGSSTENEPG